MLVDTFSNRLKKAMQTCNYTQAQLSEKTGLDKSLISNYLSGNYKAKQDKLSILANALNVSETWLMGYDVIINEEKIDNKEKNNSPLMNKYKLLYNKLKDLPEDKQQMVINVTESIMNEIDKETDK